MSRRLIRLRVAATTAALGFIVLASLPIAGGAGAQTPAVESFSLNGEARGAELGFSFTDSIFPRLIDVSAPISRTALSSEAGNESDALASFLYPGDLISSQAGGPPPAPFDSIPGASGGFPGILQKHYPPGGEGDSAVIPIPAGPITVETGKLHAGALASKATSTSTAQKVVFGAPGGTPRIEVGSMTTTSESLARVDRVSQSAGSLAKDVAIVVSSDLEIHIDGIGSRAEAASDGINGTTSATMHLTGVEVVFNGSRYRASIDNDGLHLTGLFPSQVPNSVPVPIKQQVQNSLDEAGITLSLAEPTQITEEANADSSIGGLVVELSGQIPAIALPDVAAEVLSMILEALPPQVTDPVCFHDLNPDFPLPLCLGLNILPGPGSGAVTTVALGNVRASVGASVAEPYVVVDDGGDDGGGYVPPPADGETFVEGTKTEAPPPSDTGSPAPPPVAGTRRPAYGLVAKLGSGQLAVSGIMLLVLAVGVALGPSLRRWRSPGTP